MEKHDLSEIYTQLGGLDFRPTLQAIALTGVATLTQIQRAVGISEKVARRIIHRLIEIQASNQHIIQEKPLSGKAIRSRGRASNLYVLGELGASILRDLKLKPGAHACQLQDPAALAHAVCLLDVSLCAQADYLLADIERPISFNHPDDEEREMLRPDLVLTLPSGIRIIIEIEQSVDARLLPRLIDKLRRLARFFQSSTAQGVSPDIRVLFNVTRVEWSRTRRLWIRAVAAVASEANGPFPVRVMACLLSEFLQHPTWHSTDSFEDLLDPAMLPTFGAQFVQDTLVKPITHVETPSSSIISEATTAGDATSSPDELSLLPAQEETPSTLISVLPRELQQLCRTALLDHDITLISAYLHVFQDELDNYQAGCSTDFFRLVEIIYLASHKPDRSLRPGAGIPFGSLFLLRNYLDQPSRAELKQAIEMGLKAVRADRYKGINMVRDQTTRLCWDIILRYHGLARGGALRVNVQLPDDYRSELYIEVSIRNKDLLIGEDGILPADEPALAEYALAWFLEAPLLYADLLGLLPQK